jgi:hypothetical protein
MPLRFESAKEWRHVISSVRFAKSRSDKPHTVTSVTIRQKAGVATVDFSVTKHFQIVQTSKSLKYKGFFFFAIKYRSQCRQ